MLKSLKAHKAPILIAVIAAIMYGSFAYDLVRSDSIKLITLYAGLFGVTYYLILLWGWNLKLLISLGVVYRLVFLFALPNLSQDFYRFLWDGSIVLQGGNPYLFTPEAYLSHPQATNVTIGHAQELYEGMGALNGSHFSNYPPINQLCFAIAALFGGKSIMGGVIALRLLIVLADLGVLVVGIKLLKLLNLPLRQIFWYFLNPFIIIELSGNLHFEGVMLFFLLSGLFALVRQKWLWAVILIAISISVKLIPLLFLPVLIQSLWKNSQSYLKNFYRIGTFYASVIVLVVLSFVFYFSEEVYQHYISTTALWFQNFEFNASIYYIVRWIGFQVVGWNVIETAGKILPFIVLLFVLCISFFRRNNDIKSLCTALLFSVCFYFLLSTTVHPWYLATPLLLSVFTRYRFPLLWSLMVVLSYTAYHEFKVQENLYLVSIEYVVVIGYAIKELCFTNPRTQKPIPDLQNT